MDEEVLKHYLDQVPVEIREAVMELDTRQKWAVYIALTVDGDKYFNQLKKQFNANPKTLNDVLRSLVAGGLVNRKVKTIAEAGDTNRNYYTATKLGEKLLMNLYEVVLPPLAIADSQRVCLNITGPSKEEIRIIRSPQQDLTFESYQKSEPLEISMEGVRT